jgi:hypothetical protein
VNRRLVLATQALALLLFLRLRTRLASIFLSESTGSDADQVVLDLKPHLARRPIASIKTRLDFREALALQYLNKPLPLIEPTRTKHALGELGFGRIQWKWLDHDDTKGADAQRAARRFAKTLALRKAPGGDWFSAVAELKI